VSSKKQAGEQSHTKKPAAPVVTHEPAQVEVVPFAHEIETLGPGGDGRAVAPGTQALRQRAVLQMQQRYGNEYVQRLLAQQKPDLAAARSQPHIQRQDDEIPELSEAEKAAALAAAAAAEAAASQSASEGQQEVANSQGEKAAEQEKGQVAEQKVVQEAGAAKSLGDKARGDGARAKEVGQKGGIGKKPGANGAAPDGKEVKGGPLDKAPASPEEDAGFQQVIAKARGLAEQKKEHDPAEKKAGEAQEAAESPAAEIEARAQDQQVGEMEQAETPAFDAAAFKAQLMQRIQALAPTTAKEADEFKQSNKLGGLKDGMKGQVSSEKEASQQPMAEKVTAAPDTGSVEPKPVTPLEPADPGAPPEKVGAEAAAPKPKSSGEVEQPLREETKQIDQEMADADITEEQLKKSNEPQFQSAVEARKEAKSHAVEAPQDYRQEETGQLDGAQADAATTAADRTQAMHDDRAALLAQVEEEQGQTKSEDEQKRAEIAAHIHGIYEQTKEKVDKVLNDLDGEVERVFDAGAEAAKKAFEDYVDAKMKAYKERRYGGWLGWARWVKDKVAGMPSEVNAFYSQGRQLYINKMDAVIDNVVALVGRVLTQAKAEIAAGKKAIQEYVAGLPEALQGIGQEAAQDIQGKFDELEQSVDSKQDELIDSLAQKYNENLQAIDARIEELKAANQGLVDKAIGAVKGVIETIKQLKDMLLGVLASAVDAIGKILKDPIGFLGNLISGIKQGLQNFAGNIGAHLKKGLMGWLFGELAKSGIQLPESFDLKGILTLVMQVLGLTWENLRARAVKMFGEKVVSALEKGFEIFTIVKEQGIGGLWEFIKDKLSSLKDTVIEGIKDMVITQVIKAGITWLIGILGGPAGAFIKAAKAIYDIVMWFINNAAQMAALVQAIVGSVSAIASGSLGQAAKYIEDTLARFIPLVIGFLASLLGLGNLGQKIRGIIQKVQEPINKAIDWVLQKAKAAVKKVGKMLGLGKEDAGPDQRSTEQKQQDLDKGLSDADELLQDQSLSTEDVRKQLPRIKKIYRLNNLELVTEDPIGNKSAVHVRGAVNPEGKTPSHSKKKEEWPPFEIRINYDDVTQRKLNVRSLPPAFRRVGRHGELLAPHLRGASLEFVAETVIGPPAEERRGAENQLPVPAEVGMGAEQLGSDARQERAHGIGAGFGTEFKFVAYAPQEVNQILQNKGIEKVIRSLFAEKLSDQAITVRVSMATHPGTMRVKSITYRVVGSEGGKGNMVEAGIHVGGTVENPVVRTDMPDAYGDIAASLQGSVVPLVAGSLREVAAAEQSKPIEEMSLSELIASQQEDMASS
jgi:hypothetical protein